MHFTFFTETNWSWLTYISIHNLFQRPKRENSVKIFMVTLVTDYYKARSYIIWVNKLPIFHDYVIICSVRHMVYLQEGIHGGCRKEDVLKQPIFGTLGMILVTQQWCSHWGARGKSITPDSKKKIAKNRGKIRKKEDKLGRKCKNLEGSFTLPLLTDRAGYATVTQTPHSKLPYTCYMHPPPWVNNKSKTLPTLLWYIMVVLNAM